MSLVTGKKIVKNYDDFRDTTEKIKAELDEVTIPLPGSHGYNTPFFLLNETRFSRLKICHLGNSTVLFEGSVSCLEEEAKRNYEGSNMRVYCVVIGKDHEDVRERLSETLKKFGIEIEREGNITKDDYYHLYPKLVEKGILKED